MRNENEMRKAAATVNYGSFGRFVASCNRNQLNKMLLTEAFYKAVDAVKTGTDDTVTAAQAILALNRSARADGNGFLSTIIQNREGAVLVVDAFLASMERYYWETAGEMIDLAA